jgi:hypothetical protein
LCNNHGTNIQQRGYKPNDNDMLTDEKRVEIRNVLKQVNVSAICASLKINRTGIWRTLNGKGKMYDQLEQVVKVAREQQSKLESKLQSL